MLRWLFETICVAAFAAPVSAACLTQGRLSWGVLRRPCWTQKRPCSARSPCSLAPG
jgi:hypothetical protein